MLFCIPRYLVSLLVELAQINWTFLTTDMSWCLLAVVADVAPNSFSLLNKQQIKKWNKKRIRGKVSHGGATIQPRVQLTRRTFEYFVLQRSVSQKGSIHWRQNVCRQGSIRGSKNSLSQLWQVRFVLMLETISSCSAVFVSAFSTSMLR